MLDSGTGVIVARVVCSAPSSRLVAYPAQGCYIFLLIPDTTVTLLSCGAPRWRVTLSTLAGSRNPVPPLRTQQVLHRHGSPAAAHA